MAESTPAHIRAEVIVIYETPHKDDRTPGEWQLYYQWCRWHYWQMPTGAPAGEDEHGYRFIWRREDGSLQAARGQARLPSRQEVQALMDQAHREGWGELTDQGPYTIEEARGGGHPPSNA